MTSIKAFYKNMDMPSKSPSEDIAKKHLSYSVLEARIKGSFFTRFWLELFGNSAHFPIAICIFEMLIESPLGYLRQSDLYAIVTASIIQAYYLTKWQSRPASNQFWGNLIGPAFYTVVEVLLEGLSFFYSPHHLAYWGYSIVIGSLQALRYRFNTTLNACIIVSENMVRTSILFFMYALFEIHANPTQGTSLYAFFKDTSHQFIGLVVLFLGFSIGLANLTIDRYLGLLKETSSQLQKYSEWLLGRELLIKSFVNPSALELARRERTVMFMDIRGFTRWSEVQLPENVASLLTRYYQETESILNQNETIKFKFSADEVLAVFPTVDSAIHAALELSRRVNQLLSSEGLGVGIGLHTGLVVEGLLGSRGVRFYDLIGDTVNTAKRIENAAQAGEVLISEQVYNKSGQGLGIASRREITVKGKKDPLVVYSIKT